MIYTVSFEGKHSLFSVGFKSTNLPLFTNLINQRETNLFQIILKMQLELDLRPDLWK